MVQCLNWAFNGNWRRLNLAWAHSWAFGSVWVHYKTHVSFILCFKKKMTYEDFVCFEQLIPYTWKKWVSFLKALKFMTPLVKTIVCWTLVLNLLEDPNIDSFNIFIFNLPLIWSILFAIQKLGIHFWSKRWIIFIYHLGPCKYCFWMPLNGGNIFSSHKIWQCFFYHRQTMTHKWSQSYSLLIINCLKTSWLNY